MSLAHACRLALGLIVLSTPFLASAMDPTTLSGHVEVGADDQPVAGARIEVREAKVTATTDASGNYRLGNIAPGVYTVAVSVKGQRPMERKVTIETGGAAVANFLLGADMKSLEQVNVNTATLTPEAQARALAAAGPQHDFRAARGCHPTPAADVNAGEAARRLPGVSLETDTGEGRFVNIRGLDADLNSTTFDGVRLMPSNVSTPTGGGRAVAFDSIPAGLVGSMMVTNTNLPEQDAEALGGTIEISSKTMPKGRDEFLDAQIGTGYENLRDTPIKDYQLTGGLRFGSERWL